MPPDVVSVLSKQGISAPVPIRSSCCGEAAGGVERHAPADGLREPFGMLLHEGYLYVANTDGLVRFPFARAIPG